MAFLLQSNQRVVMIGDSITDSDRRGGGKPFGHGYVRMIHDLVTARYPERQIEFINQGISGNTVRHLAARWEQHVLAARPDWVSISIGINDVWQQLDSTEIHESLRQYRTPDQAVFIDEYARTYRRLLEQTVAGGNTRLILMETSVIEENANSRGNQLLIPYNACIRSLAAEFDAVLVPMRRTFFEAIARRPATVWIGDGVHPNSTGHALMALAWLQAMGW